MKLRTCKSYDKNRIDYYYFSRSCVLNAACFGNELFERFLDCFNRFGKCRHHVQLYPYPLRRQLTDCHNASAHTSSAINDQTNTVRLRRRRQQRMVFQFNESGVFLLLLLLIAGRWWSSFDRSNERMERMTGLQAGQQTV